MLAKDREKTGMTLLKVVYNKTENTLIRVYFMCFFLTEILRFGCAEGAPSSGRSPGRSVVPYSECPIIKIKRFSSGSPIPFGNQENYLHMKKVNDSRSLN